MKTKTLKICYASVAAALFISSVPFVQLPKSFASEYRTEYTIYGDVNGDKVIDTFDVISLNRAINAGKYDKLYDLNCDEKTDSEDVALLRKYILGDKTIFEAYYREDADGDNICDFSEIKEFGTDPDSADTDKDGLSDLDEIVSTKTSPLDKYSNGTSISDGEFDSDSDGLSNVEEVKLKTDPLNEDSDYDGLTDSEEINKYKTDPVNYDSDRDAISDGDEVLLKFDPLNSSSNGQIQDGDITIEQEISNDSIALADFNKQTSSYDLSINLSASGYAENNIFVDRSTYRDIIDESILACEPIDIIYNDNLKVDSAKINFTLNDKMLTDTSIENYMLFQYNKENNCLLPVKTEYDGNTIYCTTDELGTYCVIDTKKYSSVFKNFQKNATITPNLISVQFMIDITEDQKDTFNQRINFIKDTCDEINKLGCKVLYEGEVYYSRYSKPYNSEHSSGRVGHEFNMTYNVNEFKSSLDNIELVDGSVEDNIELICGMLEYNHAHSVNDEFRDKLAADLEICYVLTDKLPDPSVIDEDEHDAYIHSKYGEIITFGTELNIITERGTLFNYVTTTYSPHTNVLKEDYGCNTYNINDIQSLIDDIKAELQIKNSFCLNSSLTPYNFPEYMNRYEFITLMAGRGDITKVPASDENGNVNFKEACLNSGITNSKNLFSFSRLQDLCLSRTSSQEGYNQLLLRLDESVAKSIEILYVLPFTVLPTDYNSNDNGTSEYKEVFTRDGKTYCKPPTYYAEIKPENRYIHEEGVNGEYKNGTWISWY